MGYETPEQQCDRTQQEADRIGPLLWWWAVNETGRLDRLANGDRWGRDYFGWWELRKWIESTDETDEELLSILLDGCPCIEVADQALLRERGLF